MNYLKKIVAVLLLCILFTSCSGKQGEYDIRVISTYPYLEGLSEGTYSTPSDDPNDPYKNCLCVVSEFYGNLLITDKISYENFVSGVSYKKSFLDYWGDETGLFHQDENGDNEVITTESLIAIIPCANGEDFLAVTGGIYGGRLHLIVGGESADDHEIISLSGMPQAFSYTDINENEAGCFFIATEKALLRVDASAYLNGDPNGKIAVKEYRVPKYWGHLEINSMCLIGDMLYMGTQKGMLSFYVELERYAYYPVDYETAINGETD
jgi:hypothetical protein